MTSDNLTLPPNTIRDHTSRFLAGCKNELENKPYWTVRRHLIQLLHFYSNPSQFIYILHNKTQNSLQNSWTWRRRFAFASTNAKLNHVMSFTMILLAENVLAPPLLIYARKFDTEKQNETKDCQLSNKITSSIDSKNVSVKHSSFNTHNIIID